MATTIQIKRSSTASGVPLATDLAVGELAVNLADKRLFTKQSDGTIIELSTNPTDLDAATLRIDGVEITASATELNKLDGFTGSTTELNILDGLTATTIELNTLDGITASTAELNKLDGYTGSTAELNILDGVTATTAEINKLDGFTGVAADLNYAKDLRATGVTTTEFDKLDGLTATTAELNILDGVTATTAELNITDGLTATTAELNTLDGITATTTELNYTDGVTSNIQTQLDGKATTAQGALADSAVQPNDDVTLGTVQADGLTVDGGITANLGSANKVKLNGNYPYVDFAETDTTDVNTRLQSSSGNFLLRTVNDADTAAYTRLKVDHATGDVSFYEDTGTTAKMVWDASAESLGIGTASPRTQLDISSTSPTITLTSPAINWAGGEVLGGIDWYTLDSSGIGAHEIGNIFLEQKGTSSTPVVDMVFATSTANASPTERMRIDSTGNVGIGTASPSCALSVATNGGSWTTSSSDGVGINYNSGNANISTYLDNSTLKIGAGVTQKNGLTIYGQTGGNRIQFDVAGSERARIDSSGNLLVGTTSNSSNVAGVTLGNGGLVTGCRSANYSAIFNRLSTDGDIAQFRKDGATVGSIGSTSSQLYIGSTVSGVRFGSSTVFPANSDGSSSDADTDLGTSSVRFKDLYLGGGVYLGGTGAANKLDDYEEGVWTPTITGSTTAGTHSSIIRGGEYVKVGSKVTVSFFYSGSSGTGSGELRLGGLPFTIDYSEASGVPFANFGLVFNSGWSPMWIMHSPSEFKIRAMSPTGGNFQAVAYSGNLSYLRGTLTYFTDQ